MRGCSGASGPQQQALLVMPPPRSTQNEIQKILASFKNSGIIFDGTPEDFNDALDKFTLLLKNLQLYPAFEWSLQDFPAPGQQKKINMIDAGEGRRNVLKLDDSIFIAHYNSMTDPKKKAMEQASTLLNCFVPKAHSKLISTTLAHPVKQIASVYEYFVPSDNLSIHALRKALKRTRTWPCKLRWTSATLL